MGLEAEKVFLTLLLALGKDQEIVEITQALHPLSPGQGYGVIDQALEDGRGNAQAKRQSGDGESFFPPRER